MLEKPNLPDGQLIDRLRDEYFLPITGVEFLPLGADVNTAVYRAVTADASEYFVKLRGGEFDETPILIPRFLAESGVEGIISPIATSTGALWTRIDVYTAVLYPFIHGEDGFTRNLSEKHWVRLGDTLRRMHDTRLPDELAAPLPRETFGDQFRTQAEHFQGMAQRERFVDSAAVDLAKLMAEHRETISTVIARAGQLGVQLNNRPHQMVVCHGDIHAGNVLIAEDSSLFVVDWDTLILAPRERDLMYVGAGIGLVWNSPEEDVHFYRGYGHQTIDGDVIAYYRYERIVQDIVEFCKQLLLSDEGGDDRAQAVYYFESQFLPGSVVEMAFGSDTDRS